MKSCVKDPHARCHKHLAIVKELLDLRSQADTIDGLNYGGRRVALTLHVTRILAMLELQPEEVLS